MTEVKEWVPPMQRKAYFKTPKEARILSSVYKQELVDLKALEKKLGGKEKALKNKEYVKRLKRNKERSKKYLHIIEKNKEENIKRHR